MGVRKTNLFGGAAALCILVCAAASGAVESETGAQQERAGPAVIAVIFLSDANTPRYAEPAAVGAGQQRLEERIANTDLSTLIKVYCRLAEATLRSQGRQERRQTGVRYVYLSAGVDWPAVSGEDGQQNLLLQLPPALLQEDRREAAERRVMPRRAEELAALDEEALYDRLEIVVSDPVAVQALRRLVERARAEQDAGFEVSYRDANVPHRQWSQTVVPEPSTVALLAMGCAMAFRRGKRR